MKTNSIIIENLTSEQLKNSLQDVIRQELKRFNDRDEKMKYLTRREVSELLKISLPTLHLYTKNGIISASKIGSRVLYEEEEIQNALTRIETLKYKRG